MMKIRITTQELILVEEALRKFFPKMDKAGFTSWDVTCDADEVGMLLATVFEIDAGATFRVISVSWG